MSSNGFIAASADQWNGKDVDYTGMSDGDILYWDNGEDTFKATNVIDGGDFL